jgi:hypothetical protein
MDGTIAFLLDLIHYTISQGGFLSVIEGSSDFSGVKYKTIFANIGFGDLHTVPL